MSKKETQAFDLGIDTSDQPITRERSLSDLSAEEQAFIKGVPTTPKKKQKKVRMTVDLPVDLHHKMKVLALRKQSSLAQEGYEAIKAWVEKPSQVKAVHTGMGARTDGLNQESNFG
jgi:hypothetical protein